MKSASHYTETYAVFIDKLKISDYGSIQFVKASEYSGNKSPRYEGVAKKKPSKVEERSKKWALDDRTNKKLDDIISRVSDQ